MKERQGTRMCSENKDIENINKNIQTKCRQGKHEFILIDVDSVGLDEYRVVHWCVNCGSIIVDKEYDGRVYRGYYNKLRIPEIINVYEHMTDTDNKAKTEQEQEVVKSIEFPAFEEWLKTLNFRGTIGAYNYEVGVFSWGKTIRILFAVSTSQYPLSIDLDDKIYWTGFDYIQGKNEEELKKWYNNTIKDFNKFWKEFIEHEYLR